MGIKIRLFGLRRAGTTSLVEGVYFSDQARARKERDRLTATNNVQYVVCPGPDHKRYNRWLVEMERDVNNSTTEGSK